MELKNEFTVDVPVDEAWAVLTDLERIAPCMPGAALEEVEGDEYRGVVKVKVGPVTAQYQGKASFLERDQPGHRAVLRAEGRETRGQGNASATITAALEPAGSGTRVSVVTDLSITGRVAQMGRGVLADVSNKLLGQFVQSLESTVLAGAQGSGSPAPTGASEPASSVEGSLAPAPVGRAAPAEGAPRRRRAAKKDAPAPAHAAVEAAAEAAVAPDVATADRVDVTQGNGSQPSEPAPGPRRIAPGREVAPVDLLEVAGPSIAVRVIAPIAVVVVLLAILRRRRRRHDG
jgi:carbon monoxide dehydrogenase subunit G